MPQPDPRPVDDDVEGERLAAWVRKAVAARRAPPVVVVLRPERTDLVALASIATTKIPVPRFVASMARSQVEDAGMPYAIGVIGVVQARRRGAPEGTPGIPMAVTFVEWPDNRWWFWKALVAADGVSLRPGTEVVQRATEGDAMPSIFGRWWALARRENLELRLTKTALVH